MSVIAEWVSTDDQSQRLRLLGCDFVQGNRIGEAVAANEFTTSRATSAERRA
jgi:EAL domain-containing protein (putative c-di-GMP-specific phosphodiesterase class I)